MNREPLETATTHREQTIFNICSSRVELNLNFIRVYEYMYNKKQSAVITNCYLSQRPNLFFITFILNFNFSSVSFSSWYFGLCMPQCDHPRCFVQSKSCPSPRHRVSQPNSTHPYIQMQIHPHLSRKTMNGEEWHVNHVSCNFPNLCSPSLLRVHAHRAIPSRAWNQRRKSI